jgi:type III pantothenate kinase
MLLVFDLGNSRFKWALTGDDGWRPGAAETYGEDFPHALDAALGALAPPAAAAAVSVTSAARTAQLEAWLQARWGVRLQRITAQSQALDVTNSYAEAARLGADRWAALVAARARRAGAVCVVDCGTAVTVDALDAAGVFRGGVILAGLAPARAALLERTDGLRVPDGAGGSCLARTTADAIAAGSLYGLAGAIDRVLDEQAAALGVAPAVLITGGDAPLLQPLLRHAAEPAPELVLEGVACLARAGAAP